MKKLRLSKETVYGMDVLRGVVGGDTLTLVACSQPTGDGCWVSRGFTNCTYCNGRTYGPDCQV
jgi:hypothetical protein